MGLYWVKNYRIPNFKDPDGGSVKVIYLPTSLSDFVRLDEATNTLTFTPKEQFHIGHHSIMICLIDMHSGTSCDTFILFI